MYVLAAEEVWKTFNIDFMPKHFKYINFRVEKISQKLQK